MDHFSDILSSAVRPMIGYGDGLAALAIAEAAMESHLESRTVAIQY
jgi:predicted dehydrogenase